MPQERRMQLSPHFQQNINWWQSQVKYNITKTKRYRLTPFQLFPITTLEERRKYYETDASAEEGAGWGGMVLRWGCRKYCLDRGKVKLDRTQPDSPVI